MVLHSPLGVARTGWPAVGHRHEQVPGPGKGTGRDLAADAAPQVLELGRGVARGLGLALEPAAADHQPVAGARGELHRVVLQSPAHQAGHLPAHRGLLQLEVHVRGGAVQVVQRPAPGTERLVLGERQPRGRDEGLPGGPPLLPAFPPGLVGRRPGSQERDNRALARRCLACHVRGASSSSSGSRNTLCSRKLASRRGGGGGATGTAASRLRRRSASMPSRACRARWGHPGPPRSGMTLALPSHLRCQTAAQACRPWRPAPGVGRPMAIL